jgi:hypothetical protein
MFDYIYVENPAKGGLAQKFSQGSVRGKVIGIKGPREGKTLSKA